MEKKKVRATRTNGRKDSNGVCKRQIMRQSLNSTPPVMGGAASGIRPEDYLTTA